MTGYYKARDKKKKCEKTVHKCYTPVSQCFIQEFELVILKLRYVCTRIEQISKYVVADECFSWSGKEVTD